MDVGDDPAAAHEVTLSWRDGREATVDVRGDETVLDATERAGIALPFGCRTGACVTCAGQLMDGRIEHVRPARALKPRHCEAGYVLCCIATPRTDCRIAVGAGVSAELVSNPWRR